MFTPKDAYLIAGTACITIIVVVCTALFFDELVLYTNLITGCANLITGCAILILSTLCMWLMNQVLKLGRQVKELEQFLRDKSSNND